MSAALKLVYPPDAESTCPTPDGRGGWNGIVGDGQQTPPAGSKLITIQEAAQRATQNGRGKTLGERAIQSRCEKSYLAAGLAVYARDPGRGRKQQLMVWEHADPLFARVASDRDVNYDVKQIRDDHRAILWWKLDLVKAAAQVRREADRGGESAEAAVETLLATVKLVKPSDRLHPPHGAKVPGVRGFRNWERDYFKGDDRGRSGLAALVMARWESDRPSYEEQNHDDPFFEELRARYLNDRQPSLMQVWKEVTMIALRQGWPERSLPQCKRYVKSLPEQVKIRFREGLKAYEDKAEPFYERDYRTLATNDLWNSDHHQLDVWATIDGKLVRPWLTAWQDLRSRRIVGWFVSPNAPNQFAILDSIAEAMERLGGHVPSGVYIDNGKDFDAKSLQGITKKQRKAEQLARLQGKPVVELDDKGWGIFRACQIDVTHAWPYRGQSKPIERFFGRLEAEWGKRQPTYTGNKPENRPDSLADKLKRGAAPPLSVLAADLVEWIEEDFNKSPHMGQGMDGRSPLVVYEQCLPDPVNILPAPVAEVVLHPATSPLKVRQNGVTWKDSSYGNGNAFLFKYFDEKIRLRIDRRDARRATAWSLEGKFICELTMNGRMPFKITPNDMQKVQSAKKKTRKQMAEYHRNRPVWHHDTADMLRKEAAARHERERREQPPEQERNLRPVAMALGDQVAAAARHGRISDGELRAAVGAEGTGRPRNDTAELMMQAAERWEQERREAAEAEPDILGTLSRACAEKHDLDEYDAADDYDPRYFGYDPEEEDGDDDD
jgi:transposase InsO family protein